LLNLSKILGYLAARQMLLSHGDATFEGSVMLPA